MKFLYVFIGGGLGAVCRWLIAQFISHESGFPWATLTANMLGCFLIGLAGYFILGDGNKWNLLLMVGFLGGFTTFSSYGFELMNMSRLGELKMFVTYFILSNLLGILLVVTGYKLGSLMKGI